MRIVQILEEREATLRVLIDEVNEQLAEFSRSIIEQGAIVRGSRGQVRPHPLLVAEREMRRERARALDELEGVVLRLHNARLVEQANNLMGSRAPSAIAPG